MRKREDDAGHLNYIIPIIQLLDQGHTQTVEAQTCQTSPEGLQMTIKRSDCFVGHKMEKLLLLTPCSVLKWGS